MVVAKWLGNGEGNIGSIGGGGNGRTLAWRSGGNQKVIKEERKITVTQITFEEKYKMMVCAGRRQSGQ